MTCLTPPWGISDTVVPWVFTQTIPVCRARMARAWSWVHTLAAGPNRTPFAS